MEFYAHLQNARVLNDTVSLSQFLKLFGTRASTWKKIWICGIGYQNCHCIFFRYFNNGCIFIFGTTKVDKFQVESCIEINLCYLVLWCNQSKQFRKVLSGLLTFGFFALTTRSVLGSLKRLPRILTRSQYFAWKLGHMIGFSNGARRKVNLKVRSKSMVRNLS